MSANPTLAEKHDAAARQVEDRGDDAVLKPDDVAFVAAAQGQATTGFETLGLLETVKVFKVATLACFAAAFSAATDGYQIGINASIIANAGFVTQFATDIGKTGVPALATPVLSGWSSIMSVGQVIGMVSISFISSSFGRKIAMYTLWLVLALSVLTESLSRHWWHWLIGKLLAGIGVGAMQATLPTYIAEVAPVQIRGGLLMCYSFWWTVGGFTSQIALRTMNADSPMNWLTPIYTQWSQIGLMLIIYVFLPESPAWCVDRGNLERARRVMTTLYAGVEGFDIDQQIEVLALSCEHERAVAREQKREKWYAIFLGVDGIRTVVSLWSLVSQQFIGLTLFATFGAYFFQQAGLADPFTAVSITSSLNIVTITAAILIADKIGRRWMACSATTLCLVACIGTGILGVAPQVKATTYLLILFACLWNIGMTCNGAAAWGFIAEISSQRLRPYTAGFAAACSAIVGIIMNVLTPYMVNQNQWNWGMKTGWFYVGVGLPFVIGMWLLIPETKGRSAAELDELFNRKIKPWRFHKTETATQRLVKSEKGE